jgi:uncharacterized membrane protein
LPQLGSGNSSGYPLVIDTKQIFANGSPAAPDDATRLDAELANDILAAVVNIQTTLGAQPQGVFGSLAARLQQFAPGGTTTPGLFSFTGQTTVSIPGTTHNLGTAALHVRVYDTAIPANLIVPDAVTIDQTTYDVVVTFAVAQSGLVILHGGLPQYTTAFVEETSVTIDAATHNLGTGLLLVTAFTTDDPMNVMTPAAITIHPSTFQVVVTFGYPVSGTLILSAAGPRHATTFTSQTTVTVPGTTHGLQSRALLAQLFDANTPAAFIEPNTLTINASTFDVTATFAVPQSGALLLVKAQEITGTEFIIRDGGITDSTATQVFSEAGTLNLQYGEGNALRIKNKNGVIRAQMNDAGQLGLGMAATHQLTLSTDSAAKPSTNTWTISSDARLKEVRRPFTDGLAILMQIEPVWYRYNGLGGMPQTKQEYVGVLAQAVQTVASYLVGSYRGKLTPDGEDTDILTYEGHAMTFLLLNAVKELALLLDAQTTYMDALTARVTQLETTLASAQEPPA